VDDVGPVPAGCSSYSGVFLIRLMEVPQFLGHTILLLGHLNPLPPGNKPRVHFRPMRGGSSIGCSNTFDNAVSQPRAESKKNENPHV